MMGKLGPNAKIIHVDDQKENLIVFEAQLGELWEIKSFLSTGDALRELKLFNPSIILSDMRMGKVNGVEFLREAMEILPDAIRIIITGYADEQLMIAAIRYAHVFDYIRKPYEPTDLEVRLQKALNQYEAGILAKENLTKLQTENTLLKARNADLLEQVNSDVKSVTKNPTGGTPQVFEIHRGGKKVA